MAVGFSVFASQSPGDAWHLENDYLRVSFDERGLRAIAGLKEEKTVLFAHDAFDITIDGRTFNGSEAEAPVVEVGNNTVTYRFSGGSFEVDVLYELQPGWRFLSKQLSVLVPDTPAYRVDRLEAFSAEMAYPVAGEYRHYEGRYATFLRLEEENGEEPAAGVFFAYANPFMEWERNGGKVSMAYSPDMEWRAEYGPFVTDRALIGLYTLTGHGFPVRTIPEWRYVPDPAAALRDSPVMDIAESEAMTRAVEAFLMYDPEESLRLHVGWTLNDYQIDVAEPEGREEYRRIIDRAAEVGARHILYTPDHTGLNDLALNRDAWGWENLLWLNLGQKLRLGEWLPGRDPLPDDVVEMIEYADSQNIGLLAYVYPTMPWMEDPEWTAWIDGPPGGYAGADTGIRSFQDWFIDLLVEFYEETGITGYSFDHWWVRYDQPGTTSFYAQWHGTRRILEELRRRAPDVVIDGRQQYHQTGPWTWLAGSFPHPLASDEQAQSFRAFPDLSWSRISANRQRSAAWWFHMLQFTPNQVMPGYMTHQTQRFDGEGHMHRRRFRPRDWDYTGWQFSVLSSIGTAPVNHVINFIPARDPDEFEYFSERDKQWFRDWLDWTDLNMEVLLNLRPIIGQPVTGRVDGTAAIVDDRGFIFLFNPNYRAIDATFSLDRSIGLTAGDAFLLRELYPQEGKWISAPGRGIWSFGDEVTIAMHGTEARVLELVPYSGDRELPLLLNVAGDVALQDDRLIVSNVSGAIGHEVRMSVLVPEGRPVGELFVNGQEIGFHRNGDLVSANLRFAGERFDQAQQIGDWDPSFAGGDYTAVMRIPQRIFDQLERNRENWPIPYTEEDLLATWLGPHRLLLYVQIADPRQDMEVSMLIDGETAALRPAFSSVYAQPPGQVADVPALTFLGYYADLTSELEAGRDYEVTVSLPEMEPGRFQGLFIHNIQTEYTGELEASTSVR